MTHKDLVLLVIGSLVPNNLLIWTYQKLFKRHHPGRPRKSRSFTSLAIFCGNAFGSPGNFSLWLVLVGAWIWSGPYFHFSNTWQLMINTPTTIIELFAAILIQYVGNRIERRQEEHQIATEQTLSEVRAVAETLLAIMESDQTDKGR